MSARAVLASLKHQATEEVLTIAAMLSVQSVWRGSRGARKAFDEARARCVFVVMQATKIMFVCWSINYDVACMMMHHCAHYTTTALQWQKVT